MKEKEKIKRYENEINQMEEEYDKYREKDPEIFNTVSLKSFV